MRQIDETWEPTLAGCVNNDSDCVNGSEQHLSAALECLSLWPDRTQGLDHRHQIVKRPIRICFAEGFRGDAAVGRKGRFNGFG